MEKKNKEMTASGTDKLTTNAVKASHISLLFCPSVFTHLPPALDPHCIYPPFTPGFQSTAWECEMSTRQTKRQRNRDFKGHIMLFTSKISKVGPCLQQKKQFDLSCAGHQCKEAILPTSQTSLAFCANNWTKETSFV